MSIKLAIFDFDGTLADSFALFAESLNELAARHAFRQISQDELHLLRGLSAMQMLHELQIPLWRTPKILADFSALMHERINEIQPFSGFCDTLHSMADRQIVLAVATSNTLPNVKAVLGHELLKRFAAVECSASLFGKARRLQQIVHATGMEKSATLYIGDEIRDAQAARKAGVGFGAVAWGYTDAHALDALPPAMSFKQPIDLLDLI